MKLLSLPYRAGLASNAAVRRVIATLLMFAICGTVTASGFVDDLPSLNACASPKGAQIRESTNQNTRSRFFSLGTPFLTLQHSQLLPQSQILKGQVTALSKSCHNQNSQPSHCLDHGLECGGNRLNNRWLSSRWSFGER